ncbi:hypothetical protein ACFX10_017630 [Malus domestica]
MEIFMGLKLELEHNTCIVDLLVRAGMVEEVEKFIEDKMGGLGRGDANAWGALLAAGRVHGNVEVGDRTWKKLAAGLEFETKRVRNMISEAGMKKKPIPVFQCSSVIEVNGVAEEFLVGDLCHPQAEEMGNTYHYVNWIIHYSTPLAFELDEYCIEQIW